MCAFCEWQIVNVQGNPTSHATCSCLIYTRSTNFDRQTLIFNLNHEFRRQQYSFCDFDSKWEYFFFQLLGSNVGYAFDSPSYCDVNITLSTGGEKTEKKTPPTLKFARQILYIF